MKQALDTRTKLLTKSPWPLMLELSIPAVLGMVVVGLYNMMDSIFVGQLVGDVQMGAVSVSYPFTLINAGSAAMLGVGSASVLSRAIGKKDENTVKKIMGNLVAMVLLLSVIYTVIGMTFTRQLLSLAGASDNILNYAEKYLRIVFAGSLFVNFFQSANMVIRGEGQLKKAMTIIASGAILNIILDPIFIFGYFGIPKMGVTGAAVATVIGQICAGLLALFFNLKVNHEIHISMKHFRPDRNTIKKIYDVGVPSIIMLSIASVMSFAINKILLRFSTTAAAVFGVYFKLQSFIFMPVFGLNNGMVPIISYNYGARKPDRIMKTLKLSITYAIVIMAIGIVVFQVFPEQLLSVFNASEDMIKLGVPALRIISISFIFAGFCIVSGSAFQALGKGFLSLSNSVIRQLVILVPVAYLLSLSGNVHIVWWAFPIAEIASVTFTSIFLVHVYKKIIKPLA